MLFKLCIEAHKRKGADDDARQASRDSRYIAIVQQIREQGDMPHLDPLARHRLMYNSTLAAARRQIEDYAGPVALPEAESVHVTELPAQIEKSPRRPTRPQEWQVGSVGVDWAAVNAWRDVHGHGADWSNNKGI